MPEIRPEDFGAVPVNDEVRPEDFGAVAVAAPPAEKPPATALDRTQAAVSGVDLGISGFIGLPVDTVENAINLAIAGFEASPGREAERKALGMQPTSPISGSFGGSEHVASIMRKLGIRTDNPRPDDPASRILHRAGMIAGGSILPGAGVRTSLAAATGGALAGEAFGEKWTGVGAMSPTLIRRGATAAKASIASKTAQNVETFKAAGATPSVGQATGSQFFHGLENLASKFPGGAGVIRKFVEKQQQDFGAPVKTGVSAEDAGRAIERGIKKEGGFLDRTRDKWLELDNAVSAKIPKDAATTPSNTLTVLDELTRPTPGAEATSRVMSTPKIAEIREAMKADLDGRPPPSPGGHGHGAAEKPRTVAILGPDGKPLVEVPLVGKPGKETLPYESLRELRSKVGAMLDNSLVTGIPGGELKKLYGALSKDLEAAANQAGAGKEFARQNDYYRARMARIDGVLEKVIGKDKQPEDIFKTFNPTDPDQANRVRAVMRSLDPSERRVVSEAIVNRLGRATPGRQGEFGEVFSTETFLTNWNKLSPGAKTQLFSEEGMRKNLDSLAKAAANIREGSKVYSNPSGTAGSFAAYAVFTAPITAAAGLIAGVPGALGVAGTAAGAAGTANIGAKMLTNPKAVEWLARAPKVRPEQAAQHLTRLAVIYNEADDDLKRELERYVESVQGNRGE